MSWFHWGQWHSCTIRPGDDSTGRDGLRNNSHPINAHPFILLSVWHLWHQMLQCLPSIFLCIITYICIRKFIIMSCWLFWAGPLSQRIWNIINSCWCTIDMHRQFWFCFVLFLLCFVFCEPTVFCFVLFCHEGCRCPGAKYVSGHQRTLQCICGLMVSPRYKLSRGVAGAANTYVSFFTCVGFVYSKR